MDKKKSLEQLLGELRADQTATNTRVSIKSFEHLSDQSVLRLYENIRDQVEADKALNRKYRLAGQAAKQRADHIQAELVSRGLQFVPIDWPF